MVVPNGDANVSDKPKPSERAVAAAKAVAEEHVHHIETTSHGYQGSTDCINETTFAEAAAPLIDQEFRAHDRIKAALETLVAHSTVRAFTEARAALALAEPQEKSDAE